MNNPVIYWVIGGLLIPFFFYLMYQFTKTWRIWHVIFMFMVFGGAIALCAYTSMTLRTHNVWRKIVREQTGKIGELKNERDLMLYGNLLQLEQSEASIRSLNAEIGRVLMDRGRVWRGCQPSAPGADESVTVTLPLPGEAGVAPPERLKKDTIVYAFIEADAPEDDGLLMGTKVPVHFVGEFAAAADSTDTVALRPLFPRTAVDKDMMRLQNVTWAIYETMPIDGHRFFVENPNEDPDLKHDNADEKPVFGTIDDALLNRTIAIQQMVDLNAGQLTPELQSRYEQMIEPYKRDGKRSNEDDPPDNVWLKVRFIKKHQEDVDTAGQPLGAIQTSEDFFDQGRAEIALLRRGSFDADGQWVSEPAEFKPGDIGIFNQDYGNKLINDGSAELRERVFVRSLNDYEGAFRNITRMLVKIDEDAREVERDTADARKSIDLVKQQIQYREEDRTKVTEDLQKFTVEKDRITDYAATLEAQWAALRTELSDLYRENQELENELARLDREIAAEADRRTLDALQDNAEGG